MLYTKFGTLTAITLRVIHSLVSGGYDEDPIHKSQIVDGMDAAETKLVDRIEKVFEYNSVNVNNHSSAICVLREIMRHRLPVHSEIDVPEHSKFKPGDIWIVECGYSAGGCLHAELARVNLSGDIEFLRCLLKE